MLVARVGGTTTVTDGSRRAVARSGERIEFREESSGFTIKLAPEVRREIEAETHWSGEGGGGFPDRKRRETGGYLFARACPHVRVDDVDLVLASGPGPDSRHAAGAFWRGSIERIEAELFATRPRELYRRCGGWHSHPVADDRPSGADLESWASDFWRVETPNHVALIVTPSPDSGWMFLRISGFVTRSDYCGRFICERATVVE